MAVCVDDGYVGGKTSVIAGGSVTGWTPEVAVVLWQRMLGSLGNVNEIRDPVMHEHVYEYLCELTDTLIKVIDCLLTCKITIFIYFCLQVSSSA